MYNSIFNKSNLIFNELQCPLFDFNIPAQAIICNHREAKAKTYPVKGKSKKITMTFKCLLLDMLSDLIKVVRSVQYIQFRYWKIRFKIKTNYKYKKKLHKG